MAVAISKVWDMTAHNGKADGMSSIGHDQLKEMTDAFSKLSAGVFEDFIFQRWRVEIFLYLRREIAVEGTAKIRNSRSNHSTSISKNNQSICKCLDGCKEISTRQHGFVKNQLISFLTD